LYGTIPYELKMEKLKTEKLEARFEIGTERELETGKQRAANPHASLREGWSDEQGRSLRGTRSRADVGKKRVCRTRGQKTEMALRAEVQF
jgi:hypothetical protein